MNAIPRLLFVCLGNICRSPMAEGAFRHEARLLNIAVDLDSAGTGGWHVGEAPDPRMIRTASSHGIDISDLRARQFEVGDFDRFDIIFVMDHSNRDNVLKLARNDHDRSKVRMLLADLYPNEGREVPDPYFGGSEGFELVIDMMKRSAHKVLSQL